MSANCLWPLVAGGLLSHYCQGPRSLILSGGKISAYSFGHKSPAIGCVVSRPPPKCSLKRCWFLESTYLLGWYSGFPQKWSCQRLPTEGLVIGVARYHSEAVSLGALEATLIGWLAVSGLVQPAVTRLTDQIPTHVEYSPPQHSL